MTEKEMVGKVKFRDIPQFIRGGNYRVDMSIPTLAAWVRTQETEEKLILCPDFQRGHVWTEAQQIAWLEFLLRGGKSGRDLYFNDPYWMNWVSNPSGYQDFVCVDGLQRITAIQRFVGGEIPVFGHFYEEYEDVRWLNTHHTLFVHINALKTKREVLQWYLDMNAGGIAHTADEIARVRKLLTDISPKN